MLSFLRKKDSNTVMAERFFDEGMNYHREEKYTKALECWEKALELKRATGLLYNLAELKLARLECIEAEKLSKESIQMADANEDLSANYVQQEKLNFLTGEFYNKETREAFLSDLKNRNYNYEYIAKRIVESSIGTDEEYLLYLYFDEIDSIKKYEYPEDYPEIQFILEKYSDSYLEDKLKTSLRFMHEFDLKRMVLYRMLVVYDMPTLRKMRSQILINLHNRFTDKIGFSEYQRQPY